MVEPMGNQRFEMLATAGGLDVFAGRDGRMPGKNLELVEPAILDQEEPALVAEGDNATNGTRHAFCGKELH